MDLYPNAKIVLNQRQTPEIWAESIGNTILFFTTWKYKLTTFLWKTDRLHVEMQKVAPTVLDKSSASKSHGSKADTSIVHVEEDRDVR